MNYAYTRTAPEEWPEPPRRVDRDLITSMTWPSNLSATCYVCGPTGFVESIAELLSMSGHRREKIRTERFGPTGEHK